MIFIVLTTLLIIRILLNNKETLSTFKKLSITQIIGVTINITLTVVIATTLIYFGGNWLAGLFSNIFLQIMIFTITTLLVLYVISYLSNKAMYKITNGILPKE